MKRCKHNYTEIENKINILVTLPFFFSLQKIINLYFVVCVCVCVRACVRDGLWLCIFIYSFQIISLTLLKFLKF